MTNNDTKNPTIALTTANHGVFRIDADHLNMVMITRVRRQVDALIAEVHALIGEENDYDDLTWIEAMILISYLTGGAVD